MHELLATQLKLEASSAYIKQAHRNGKLQWEAGIPHSIVVKLLSFKNKELIMVEARAHLKNTWVYINEDLSVRLNKKRAELLSAMREVRAKDIYGSAHCETKGLEEALINHPN